MTVIIDGTTGITSPAESVSGNLTFTGTGNRITGDFSNGTVANRVMFQTTTAASPSRVGVIPNGTTTAELFVANAETPTNAQVGTLTVTSTEVRVQSTAYGTGTGTYLPMTFYTGGSERVRIDTSGNVGIGKAPSDKVLELYSASSPAIRIQNSTTGTATSDGLLIEQSGSDALIVNYEAGPLRLFTSGTERARIDSSGNLLVNQTSQTGAEKVGISFDRTGSWGLAIKNTSSTAPNNATYVQFYYASTNTGGINSTGTTTSYATTSDYRLKENIAPMTGALAKIAALNPCTYSWKSTGETDEGFIAHELQAVCPSAVTGEKDATDVDGNPQYQGIDTSFLVATLTAAIQELKAIVDTQAISITALNERLTALEAPIV